MAGGYDGSIRVDSSIDPKGMNEGMKSLTNSAKGLLADILAGLGDAAVAAMSVAAVVAIVVSSVIALVGAIVAAGVAIVKFGISLIEQMERAISTTNEYGQEILEINRLFSDVKGAIYAAFSPLIAAALPYIKIIVAWLVNVLNTISMIVAVLMGQNTVMQYVAGSADSAASATGRLAGQTDKVGKAAKGALAAFDEINVLQQASAGAAGSMQFKVVPVDPDIITKTWDTVKDWFHVHVIAPIEEWFGWLWANIEVGARAAWDWIVMVWGIVASWFQLHVINPLVTFFTPAWNWIKQAASDAWTWIVGVWNVVASWFQLHIINPVGAYFKSLWDYVKTEAHDVWVVVSFIWGVVASWFQVNVINRIVAFFTVMWNWLVQQFTTSVALWEGIIQGFVDRFKASVEMWHTWLQPVLDWLAGAWDWVWAHVEYIAKTSVNNIITFINSMIAGVASGINGLIDAANSALGKLKGWSPLGHVSPMQIPLIPVSSPSSGAPFLASGAIIPPNAAFAAVLGDQRSGTNIEAPADLIRQIMREEGGGGGPITINFGGSLGALMRVLKPYADRENVRVGTSLIQGATG